MNHFRKHCYLKFKKKMVAKPNSVFKKSSLIFLMDTDTMKFTLKTLRN